MTRSVLDISPVFVPLQDGADMPADDFEFAATLPVGYGKHTDGLHGPGVSYAGAIDIAICSKGDEIWMSGLVVRTSLADLVGYCLGGHVTTALAREGTDIIEDAQSAERVLRLAQVLRAQASRIEEVVAPHLRPGLTASEAICATREISEASGRELQSLVQCLERLAGAGADEPPTQEEQEDACTAERPRGG